MEKIIYTVKLVKERDGMWKVKYEKDKSFNTLAILGVLDMATKHEERKLDKIGAKKLASMLEKHIDRVSK